MDSKCKEPYELIHCLIDFIYFYEFQSLKLTLNFEYKRYKGHECIYRVLYYRRVCNINGILQRSSLEIQFLLLHLPLSTDIKKSNIT